MAEHRDVRADLRQAFLAAAVISILGFGTWPLLRGSTFTATLTKDGREDFRGYYYAVKANAKGLSPNLSGQLATEETGRTCLGWHAYHPPSCLLVFRPLTWLAERPAQAVFTLLQMAAATVIWALCGALSGRPVLGTLVAAAWTAPQLHMAFLLGQPTPITTAFGAGSLLALTRGRWKLSAVLIAVGSSIKPLDVLLWLPVAAGRDRRAALASAAAFVGIGLLSATYQGTDLWWEFIFGLPGTARDHGVHLPVHYAVVVAPFLALAAAGPPGDQAR